MKREKNDLKIVNKCYTELLDQVILNLTTHNPVLGLHQHQYPPGPTSASPQNSSGASPCVSPSGPGNELEEDLHPDEEDDEDDDCQVKMAKSFSARADLDQPQARYFDSQLLDINFSQG